MAVNRTSGLKALLARLLLIWTLIVIVVFAGFEVLERSWLASKIDMATLHILHIIRGVGCSLLFLLAVGYYLTRIGKGRLFHSAPESGVLLPSFLTDPNAGLRHHAKWFIKLRWVAVAVFGMAFSLGGPVLHILPKATWLPLLLLILLLASTNALYQRLANGIANPYRFIVIQMAADLVILSGIIEFSGGLENPFYLLYLLHVIIGAVILFPRDAFRLTFVAWALLALVAAGQMTHLLPHHTIPIFPHHWHVGLEKSTPEETGEKSHGQTHQVPHEKKHATSDPLFVLGRLGALSVVMGGTAYFVTLIMTRLRVDRQRMVEATTNAMAEMEKREKMQNQLIQAGKMATIGEFTGRVAHEINNPIAIISAKAKLLLSEFGNGQLPEKVRSDLVKIDQHAGRIGNIAKSLLAFGRRTSGKKAPLDLRRVVQVSLNLVEHPLSGSGISLVADLGKSPRMVLGNFHELQQVVINLLNNAIDAMPDGGTLEVAVPEESGKSHAEIIIRDSGNGIAPDILPRIFDPMFTTKPEGKGTGLGLAICHGVVQSHGGAIEVDSSPGKGSCFTIRLPLIGTEERSGVFT